MVFVLPWPRRSPRSVLYIGPFSVEWFEFDREGAPHHARIDLPNPTPELLARAALAARGVAGARGRECVLAVSSPLAFHKLLTLPPLARKDLAQVFRRRAQAVVGEDARHVFHVGREMEIRATEGRSGEEQHVWLLAGVRGGARDLGLLLRGHDVRVGRVVSADLAALEWGRQHASDPNQAAIVIVVGEGAVSVALTEGSRLIYQESIEGDLTARPALATGLIHEIKTCAAFWKKRSRGQAVTQVVVVGLPRARVELMAVTLSSILPGAVVRATSDDSSDPSGRRALLEAALSSGPLNPELTFWMPKRRRTVALASTLAATVMLGGAWGTFERTQRRVDEVQSEVGALRRATLDMDELRARDTDATEGLERVERYVRRRLDVAGRDEPAERVLAAVLEAFAGRAEFEELRLQPLEHERTRVTILGRGARDPQAQVASLRAVLAALARSAPLTDLELVLPEDLHGEGTQGSAFTILARVKG
ncbi:MAG: hypothetical protein EXS08_01070 [Planctomycetes bacterium]|nr:hypothetical protein [Planctomycetota bacterium]